MSLAKSAHKSISVLYEHLPSIALAIVISLASGLPALYLIHAMGSAYQGIFPEFNDDQTYYDARAQESRDGFPYLGNPYILELRDEPGVSFWMPDAALSLAGESLGLDVQHTFSLSNFIFPPLLFLVSYVLLFTATRSRLAALLGASLYHLGLYFAAFTRSPSPQLNFLFVEFAILCGIWLVQERKYATNALAAALGALFYVYPYFWTFCFGAIGMFFIASILRHELQIFRDRLLAALCGGIVIGIPTLLQMIAVNHLAAYKETLFRLGMIHSHTPAGLGSIAACGIVLLAYAVIYWRIHESRRDPMFWFMGSIIFGGILAANNQIVTGNNLEFSSHYFLPAAYVALIGATYLISSYANAFSLARAPYTRPILASIIACYIGFGAMTALLPRLHEQFIGGQKYGPVVDWVRRSVPAEKVVLADENISEILPAYTSARVFYSRNANLQVMTDEEAWRRFILEHWGASLTDAFLYENTGAIWGTHYGDEYGHVAQLNKVRKLFGLPQQPMELVPQTAETAFREFASNLKKQSPEEVLGERQIDLAISDADFPLPVWMKTVYPQMHAVYASGEFTIYKLGPKKSALSN